MVQFCKPSVQCIPPDVIVVTMFVTAIILGMCVVNIASELNVMLEKRRLSKRPTQFGGNVKPIDQAISEGMTTCIFLAADVTAFCFVEKYVHIRLLFKFPVLFFIVLLGFFVPIREHIFSGMRAGWKYWNVFKHERQAE